MGKLINGNQIAADIKNEIKGSERVRQAKRSQTRSCCNTCGENPASKVCVSNKQRAVMKWDLHQRQ